MIRFTTPTQVHTLKGVDLTGCDVYVSYQQGLRGMDIPAESVEYADEDSTITVSFTQKQAGWFREGKVKVQINWVYPNGKRDATDTKEIEVIGNLLSREVRYGD